MQPNDEIAWNYMIQMAELQLEASHMAQAVAGLQILVGAFKPSMIQTRFQIDFYSFKGRNICKRSLNSLHSKMH